MLLPSLWVSSSTFTSSILVFSSSSSSSTSAKEATWDEGASEALLDNDWESNDEGTFRSKLLDFWLKEDWLDEVADNEGENGGGAKVPVLKLDKDKEGPCLIPYLEGGRSLLIVELSTELLSELFKNLFILKSNKGLSEVDDMDIDLLCFVGIKASSKSEYFCSAKVGEVSIPSLVNWAVIAFCLRASQASLPGK